MPDKKHSRVGTLLSLWGKAKATVKFLWWHFFTLFTLKILVTTILTKGSANWRNAFLMLAGAILVDWAKQFVKFYSPASDNGFQIHPSQDTTVSLSTRQWWNPSVSGSCSYNSNNYRPPKFD